MTARKVLIVGATSAIASEMARLFAARGDWLCLAARNDASLDRLAKSLRSDNPGAVVRCIYFEAQDIQNSASAGRVLISAEQAIGGLDMAVIAHGLLPNQEACLTSTEGIFHAMHVNGLAVVALMSVFAARFKLHNRGTVAVISSVAGDRGRASNFIYGSSKAMVTSFASGLGQSLRKTAVRIVTIKPGLVDSPMTAKLKKGPLWSDPKTVAQCAIRGIDKGRPTVYAPGFWWVIMAVIKTIPDRLFRLLPL